MKQPLRLVIVLIQFLLVNAARAQKPDITVTHFRDSALASTWCPYDPALVAYDLYQSNGYYQIYLANVGPGNTLLNERCFTCNNPALPGKSTAQPIFSPNGKYLLYTAEKAVHPGGSGNAIPGIGQYNDLYVSTMDGQKTYKIINMPDTGLSGMIETYFSPDGNEVMWDEETAPVAVAGKQEFGYWVVKIAPFIDDTINGPHIDSNNIRVLQPGSTGAFNEPYGWSPDGSKIIFASDYNQFWVWDDQIYTMDTLGNNLKQISSTAHNYPYCEHAFYSSDGKHIVWMTNEDCDSGSSVGGDDWWIMDSDASNQMRLTYFNDTTSSYWTGSIHINCHGSFNPNSNSQQFIGDVTGSEPVQVNPAESIGAAYIVTLNYLITATAVTNVEPPSLQCSVYPNPASNTVNVRLNGNTAIAYYSIYNMLGEVVIQGQFAGSNTSISLNDIADGMYLLKIQTGNECTNEKLMVRKM